MNDEWYCIVANEEFGPLSVEQLRSLVKSGAIKPTSLVRKMKTGWVQARQVRGLFRQSKPLAGNATTKGKSGGHDQAPPPSDVHLLVARLDRLSRFHLAVIAAGSILGLCLAFVFPWLSLLGGVCVCIAGATYFARPTFRDWLEHGVPVLQDRNRANLIVASVAAWAFLVFLTSNLVLRQNAKQSVHDAQVAVAVRQAQQALVRDDIDEASSIVQQLESDQWPSDRKTLQTLKTALDAASSERSKRRANDRIVAMEIEGHSHIQNGHLDWAEAALRKAFAEVNATELAPAKRLADAIVEAKLTSMDAAIAKHDLNQAESILLSAEQLPGIDTSRLGEAHATLANLQVKEKVQHAQELVAAKQLREAERELQEAIALKHSTDLAAARTLLQKLTQERTAAAADDANNLAFRGRKGIVRLGRAENDEFGFRNYEGSCLTVVDKLINDRQQVIEIPFEKGAEVELRFQPIALASADDNVGVSRFEVVSSANGPDERVQPKIRDGSSFRIDSRRAVAYFVPSAYRLNEGRITLELILVTSTGKTLVKQWVFQVQSTSRS